MNNEQNNSKTPIQIFVYIIIIILALFQILLYLEGLSTTWYNSLVLSQTTLADSVTTWIVVYMISLIGYMILENSESTNFLVGLTILGLSLSVLWDILFFYAQDILLALIVQIAICSVYSWIFYVISLDNTLSAILQLPLLLRSYWMFYETTLLFVNNSNNSMLRPKPR